MASESSDSVKSGDTRSAQASQRNPLPFEPTKSRKQSEKKSEKKPAPLKAAEVKPKAAKVPVAKPADGISPANSSSRAADTRVSMNIPDAVSKRMARRMALFCGIPSVLGMSTFITSYFLVSRDIVELPNVVVVLVSMGFFGLGVLGLSYGVISASWEEEETGSALGITEFGTNLRRMVGAWRSQGKKS